MLGVADEGDRSARRRLFAAPMKTDLTFAGFLLFFDPPKADVQQAIVDLAQRGVQLKIITGDNQKVARHVAEAVKLPLQGVLTGQPAERTARRSALAPGGTARRSSRKWTPTRRNGSSLRSRRPGTWSATWATASTTRRPCTPPTSASRSTTAVDVAKDAADFVLLKQDLTILRQGIDEGRMTFANTLKYILTTISANFGNMFSMAGASMLLPFLPLLAPQILLNNFLSDIPALTIAGDNVDPEMVAKPRRWNTTFIRDYMVLFGSGEFDLRFPDLRHAAVTCSAHRRRSSAPAGSSSR